MGLALLSIFLMAYAVLQSRSAARMTNDVSRSSSLRYRSLLVYEAHREGRQEDLTATMARMGEVLEGLRHSYPEETRPVYAAWQAFLQEQNKTGRVDWKTVNTLLRAADTLTRGLDRRVRQQSNRVIGFLSVGTLGIVCTLLQGLSLLRRLGRMGSENADMQRTLRETSALQRAILDSADYSIISTDASGIIRSFNATAERCLGYATEEMVGRAAMEVLHDKTELTQHALALAEELGRPVAPGFEILVAKATADVPAENEWMYIRKDGTRYPVHLSITALYDSEGQLAGYVGVGRDITTEKEAEAALRCSEERFRSLSQCSPIGIFHCDRNGDCLYTNEAWQKLAGMTLEESLGSGWGRTLHPDDREEIQRVWADTIAENRDFMMEFRFLWRDGTVRWASAHITALYADSGERIGFVGINADITDRKGMEEQIAEQMYYSQQANVELELRRYELEILNARLETLAMTDGLTGLNNHRRFQEALESEYQRALRYNTPLSLLMMDVDRFKMYNDTYGHPAGDEVLKAIAGLLREAGRETDCLARYGGEEFAILLPEADYEQALAVAERFRDCIEGADWPLHPVTASFGVATLTPGMDCRSELVRQADQALYASKESGRNCVTHCADLHHTLAP